MNVPPRIERVLLVDRSASTCAALARSLGPRGYDVRWTSEPGDVVARVRSEPFGAVVLDAQLPGPDVLALCTALLRAAPGLRVVIACGLGTLDSAVRALRAGAADFLPHPLELESLAGALGRVLQTPSPRRSPERLEPPTREPLTLAGFVGTSAPVQRLLDLTFRVAGSDASVLITGESGSGKEVIARALHQRSNRRDGPFVAINCAALPEALLESELFGHARGAFTDAKSARPGLFQRAHHGTLFLDEIGELPLGLQPKLLRALQERAVRPLGGENEYPVDVRILAATNQDLEAAMAQRRFREDLYFRINVVHLPVPALRDRGGDVLLLAEHFLEHFGQRSGKLGLEMSPAVAEQLCAYEWPGNVRELQNCIERAVTLAPLGVLSSTDLPERVALAVRSPPGVPLEALERMDAVERKHITRVLEAVSGNKTLAARTLGFDRSTLYRKLEQYGLRRVEVRDAAAKDRNSPHPPR